MSTAAALLRIGRWLGFSALAAWTSLVSGQTVATPAGVEGQIYTPGDFDRLEVAGSAHVRLTQGDRDQVFIVGGPEVQKSIELALSKNRLVIRPAGGWKFWNSSRLQIEVLVRQLNQLVISGNSDVHVPGHLQAERLSIQISGAGQARFDELFAEQLRFSISGAGDGQLSGKVHDLQLQVSGKGKLIADQLRSTRATVSISGIGNARLWVSDELRVNVSGIGTVEYWGQPEVQRASSGISSIKALGDKR
ncbi:head GIN domain-containing protein [Roseateles sp.]|uniref:head GIN domain-containing protein n=1 Tax=Roseateles sp. TaxID=1971397 RepID=UPI0037CBF280